MKFFPMTKTVAAFAGIVALAYVAGVLSGKFRPIDPEIIRQDVIHQLWTGFYKDAGK